jgi:hypothetical protein
VSAPCIVVWDDQMGVCVPLGWDDACAGAICAYTKHAAVFDNQKEARKAIDISAKFAALRKSQGLMANTDFLGECRRNLRIVPLRPNPTTPTPEASK